MNYIVRQIVGETFQNKKDIPNVLEYLKYWKKDKKHGNQKKMTARYI